jgi:hypothetical protein
MLAACTAASAEPRAPRVLPTVAADQATNSEVSLVGYFFRGGGPLGYGPGVGFDPTCGLEAGCAAAGPACGLEPSCAIDPSCGCGGDLWDGYCAPRRHGLFHHHRGGLGHRGLFGHHAHHGHHGGCGVDMVADCGCNGGGGFAGHHGHHRHHVGHRLCGFGCGHCGNPHCGPIRFWANGWCGQVVDGWTAGNPPTCFGGDVGLPAGPGMMPDKGGLMPDKGFPALPPAPEPMAEPIEEAPARSTLRPGISPRFSTRPIGIGAQ